MSEKTVSLNATKLRKVSRGGGGSLRYMESAADEIDLLRKVLGDLMGYHLSSDGYRRMGLDPAGPAAAYAAAKEALDA